MKSMVKKIILTGEMFVFSFVIYSLCSQVMLGEIYTNYISPLSGHWISAAIFSWWIINSISTVSKMNGESVNLFRSNIPVRIQSLIYVPFGIFKVKESTV